MKISKGTVKNINKKLLTSALVLTLIATPLIGCSSEEKFTYTTNKEGIVTASDTISFDKLKGCFFVVVENVDYDIIEFYIVDKKQSEWDSTWSYFNILDDRKILKTQFNETTSISKQSNRSLVQEMILGDYLFSIYNIKSEYTPKDVENILEQMKENYIKENTKQRKLKQVGINE